MFRAASSISNWIALLGVLYCCGWMACNDPLAGTNSETETDDFAFRGRVVDSAGEPVSGAMVLARRLPDSVHAESAQEPLLKREALLEPETSYTDQAGIYRIGRSREGHFSLVAYTDSTAAAVTAVIDSFQQLQMQPFSELNILASQDATEGWIWIVELDTLLPIPDVGAQVHQIPAGSFHLFRISPGEERPNRIAYGLPVSFSPKDTTSVSAASAPTLPKFHVSCADSIRSSQGLLAWYPLDGDAMDRGLHGLDGQVHGPIPERDRFGRVGAALRFDGIDDSVSLPSSQWLQLDSTFTLTSWFRADPNSQSLHPQILSNRGVEEGILFGFHAARDTVPHKIPYVQMESINYIHYRPPFDPLDGQWHHFAAVRKADTLHYFLDGMHVKAYPIQGKPDLSSNSSFLMGADRVASSTFFSGILDDISIWGKGLDADDIGRLRDCGN